MLTATELHRRGLEASNASKFVRARGLFRKALDRSEAGEERARILLSLAHVESELGGRSEGLLLCDEALDEPDLDPGLIGLIQSQRGLLLGRSGMTEQSLAAFDEAIRPLGPEPEALMRVHLNRGNVYLMRGEALKASHDFERAVVLADQLELPVQKAKAESNLGYAYMLTGDLVGALKQLDAAKPTLAALSPAVAAVCDQDRAEVLAASGMVTEAESALREAARVFGTRGLRQQQAEAELALSRLLLRDNPAESAKVARRARKRFSGRGSEGWALRADAISVEAEIESGSLKHATVTHADELVEPLKAHGLGQEAASLSLHASAALVREGAVDDARSRLAGSRLGRNAPLSTRLKDREIRAELARKVGRRADAQQHLRRGLAELHEWQSSFGSLDLQSSLVGYGRGLALQGLGLAIDDGRPDVVFEWSERARALASRVTPLRPPSDEHAVEQLGELRRLQTEIEHAEADGTVPKSLLHEAQRIRDYIRQRSWYGEGSGLVTEPASLDEITGVLDASGGSLLSYLVLDERLYSLVVAGETPRVVDLGPFSSVRALLDGMQADLDMAAAANLPAALRPAITASLDHRLDRLDAALVGPVAPHLGEGPLVLVPAGSLAGVPWTLLAGFRGRPVTVPRSATSWATTAAAPFSASSAGFVAGPRVARAGEEVERASDVWGGARRLSGEQATADLVSRMASDVDVFHVAAHGRHSADNPLFSGIELVDGPWFGYDIDQLDSIPSTVILSACEVGRSTVRWGEETIGMTVAWLHAGARCVIASPALVNDDTACEVLTATHQRLAAGDSPSLALATATTEVTTDSPAPFICFGSGF